MIESSLKYKKLFTSLVVSISDASSDKQQIPVIKKIYNKLEDEIKKDQKKMSKYYKKNILSKILNDPVRKLYVQKMTLPWMKNMNNGNKMLILGIEKTIAGLEKFYSSAPAGFSSNDEDESNDEVEDLTNTLDRTLTLVANALENRNTVSEQLEIINDTLEELCVVCQENFMTNDVTEAPYTCSHMFHQECSSGLQQSTSGNRCPLCASSYRPESELSEEELALRRNYQQERLRSLEQDIRQQEAADLDYARQLQQLELGNRSNNEMVVQRDAVFTTSLAPVYQSTQDVIISNPPSRVISRQESEEVCIICQENLSSGETTNPYQCQHQYHRHCANQALANNLRNCGVCRRGLPIEDPDQTALRDAARNAYTDSVRALLERGVNPNAPDVDGLTALMYAARDGNNDIVRLLLDRDANVNATDNNGRPALIYAARRGYFDSVRSLLEQGANPNATDINGLTAIMFAINRGNIDSVRLLLERGANVNVIDNDGLTTLMYLEQRNNIDIARLLLDRGVDINATDNDGLTALIYTVRDGDIDSVRLLLDRGANVNATDNNRRSVLMYAVQRNNIDIVRLLLDRGANVNASDDNDRPALIYAAQIGNIDIVRLLLDQGANVNVTDNNRRSALMFAAREGNIDSVRLLLERGANPNVTDINGLTAIMYAVQRNNIDVVRLLSVQDVDIPQGTNRSCNPNSPKATDPRYICNPSTRRWVLRTGTIGQQLLRENNN